MIEQIKEALEKASIQHEWDTDGRTIEWKDGHPLKGTYKTIAVTDSSWDGGITFTNDNHEADANLIANTPTYIRYLLDELEKAQNIQETMKEALTAVIGEGRKDKLKAEEWTEMLVKEARQLRTEHTAMKEALGWYAQFEDRPYYNDNGSRARTVLITLTKEDI